MSATLISGRYELGDRLGSGGMSSVYKATDRVLERTVAVKILAEHLSDDDKFVARFRREALAVAKLIHPNIVQVYDTGVDDDRHYIVMEYVEGRSGAQLLQARGRLGPETAVEIGAQACAGLDYAHRQGIIHRDVKPGNLMVIGGPAGAPRPGATAHDPPTGEMTVKLTDFGIARAAEQTRLTQVGSVVGTAAYLAPEQARGEEATPASDVYALGVVIYQLADRAPALGGSDAGRAGAPPRERAPAAAELLRPGGAARRCRRRSCARWTATPPAATRPPRQLAVALRAGLAGQEPPAARRRDDAATRTMRRRDDRGHPAPAAPSRRPPGAPPACPAPRARRRPRRPRQPAGRGRDARSPAGCGGAIGILLVIAVLAAVIAGVVLLTTNAGQNTDLIKHTIPDQIQAAQGLHQLPHASERPRQRRRAGRPRGSAPGRRRSARARIASRAPRTRRSR